MPPRELNSWLLYHDEYRVATLRLRYSAGIGYWLKYWIPATHRHIDATRRAWWIREPYIGIAVELLLSYFPKADIDPRYIDHIDDLRFVWRPVGGEAVPA